MADYIDSEADESDDAGELEEDEDDERIGIVRKPKSRVKRREEEDEEEEDDEEQLAEEMKDLIDDNEVEEEESDDDSVIGKRKRRDEEEDELDDRLEDDDYDLIEENLGVKVQRKKFRRLQQLEDDESDEDENRDTGLSAGGDREVIANELFEGEDEDGLRSVHSRLRDAEDDVVGHELPSEGEEEEYSDPDDFIVDDDGQPLTKTKRRRPRFTDASLQQAQDIFGVDIDFNDFDAYGEDDEEEVDDLDYEEEIEAERQKTKKPPRKKTTRKSIFEVYEPSELERGHFTDKDNEIRVNDIPERFQLRGIPVTPAEDSELLEEAEWIYKYAFNTPTVSNQEEDAKAAKAEHAVAKVTDKWTELKNQSATEAAAKTSDIFKDGTEDWDAECKSGVSGQPKITEEEDWDAEIENETAGAPAAAPSPKNFDDGIVCGEDWDDEVEEKAPAPPSKPEKGAINHNIESAENWVDDLAPQTGSAAKAATPAWDDGIGGDEDWDAEDTGVNASKVTTTSTQPPVKKGPSPAEIAANALADKKRTTMVKKIKEVLNFMRNHHFEVPFIAFYRKEYVEPELNINDLWLIYSWDEKWCQLSIRKANLLRLFQKMQQFQCDEVMNDPEKPLPEDLRILADEDFDRLRGVQTFEELKDAYSHFVLYYGQDISKMQESLHRKAMEERREKRAARNKSGSGVDGVNVDGEEADDDPEREDEDDLPPPDEKVKQATRVDAYTFCRRAGLASLAKKFGLTPLQFGENLRDNYQRNEVEQYPMKPLEVAQEYVSNKFPTADDVLKGARYMVAAQLAREPLVRQCVRETFCERAKVNVTANKKGVKEIDESHPCYPMKYLRNKPVKDLKDAAFLKLFMAEEDGLLSISVGIDLEGKGLTGATMPYADEIKQLYNRDEFSDVVQEWNKQRALVLEHALTKFLYPILQKELRQRLLQEARDHIIKASCRRLYSWLKMAPYTPETPMDDDEDFDTGNGIRVLAIAYVPDWDTAAFGALIDGEGEMTDFIRLPHLMKRKNAWKEADRIAKENDLENLRKFILDKKPHVVGVGGESREALIVIDDVKAVITELVDSDQIPQIGVELIDNELAKVYMNSTKAEADFREYPPLLKQAISLARRLQDPLVEFSQLCNPDDEIMCLRYHSLQDQVQKDDLIDALQLEFVNRTNEVGVDVNRAIANPHTANLVQFVCGLGPRKGQALLKILKQTNSRLENRTNLVMAYHMGPKVFINCAGFIKIDTNSMGDSTDAYVEVLDGSRVHPETYDWARKMAVDALEYDDMAEDANPAGALEEILENPEKLKDLDLDAFAEELERQGFGNRSITLYDIRAELNHRYKDLRSRYRPPAAEERFNMLTKETPETFYVGKLVLCRAVGIARRKPQGEQLDQANPVRNDDTGLWQCPFCLKNDFLEVSEVWNHFDAGSCPGQATGVRARLDNGLFGFIPTKFISDKHVTSPEERVQVGMTIHCRVVKIDIERLQADLTCRSSDLADKNHDWRPTRDVYYDADADERDCKTDELAKKRQTRQAYIKRVIVHPSFHNISFKEAEKLLDSMDQGDVIVRPSSKGSDHLTVTWKVADGIYQHIDVREEGKENAFSLGQSLWIGDEEFEDLDEIIARHVQPMAAHVRDLLAFRYYRETGGGKRDAMEKLLTEEKRKAPSKIHYLMSASKEYPGKFILSYLPRNKCRHEYVTASSEGLRYRQQMFHSVSHLIRWFKDHFRDPIPGTPVSQTGRTPVGGVSHANHPYQQPQGVASAAATPSINLSTVDPQAIQRAAKNMPHQLFNTLTQVASQTPIAGHATPYANRFGGFQQPYTPSQHMSTPMLTPSYHHHHPPPTHPHHPMATPSHGINTPRYQFPATPVTWQHSGHTPSGRTPSVSSSSSSSRIQPSHQKPRPHKQSSAPKSVSSGGAAPGAAAAASAASTTDWKKAAELWAKKQQQKNGSTGSATPKGATPRIGGGGGQTPRIAEPSGDATPLIDEWPA